MSLARKSLIVLRENLSIVQAHMQLASKPSLWQSANDGRFSPMKTAQVSRGTSPILIFECWNPNNLASEKQLTLLQSKQGSCNLQSPFCENPCFHLSILYTWMMQLIPGNLSNDCSLPKSMFSACECPKHSADHLAPSSQFSSISCQYPFPSVMCLGQECDSPELWRLLAFISSISAEYKNMSRGYNMTVSAWW